MSNDADDAQKETIMRRAGGTVSKREQLIEVSVFLFLIAPSLVVSFFIVNSSMNFMLIAGSTIMRDLALVSLILFFLRRNGEPRRAIGWTLKNAGKEVILGAVLFVPLILGANALEAELRGIGFSAPNTPLPALFSEKSALQFLLASILVVVVAFAEETIFRGYLILRLKNTTKSAAVAVLASAAIFSFGHGYEGSAGVITVGAVGAVFAVIYLWRGSLIAPMVMHFLLDFVGIVLVPLLAAR